MIISHKYKFIFIKTAKTASTSIEIYLSRYCGDKDVLTPIYPTVENHIPRNFHGFFNPTPELVFNRGSNLRITFKDLFRFRKFHDHIPAKYIKKRIKSEIWDNYFKFCIERNPWDKTISDYYMRKHRSSGDLSLEEYFDNGQYCLNYFRYTDNEENLLVDKVIKFENLNEGLNEIFELIHIPFNGKLDVNAKSEYRKDRRHYREIFSDKQKMVIEEVFQKEILMHKYAY